MLFLPDMKYKAYISIGRATNDSLVLIYADQSPLDDKFDRIQWLGNAKDSDSLKKSSYLLLSDVPASCSVKAFQKVIKDKNNYFDKKIRVGGLFTKSLTASQRKSSIIVEELYAA